MRFSTILVIGIILLTFIQMVNAEDPNSLLDNEHYVIVGHIYGSYSEDNQVILINVRTGEQLRVTAIDCEHGLQEYLFNLANLHQGWNNGTMLIITYDNISTSIIIDDRMAGIQCDINAPYDYTPISVIAGAILILSTGGYYYIKRKGDKETMTEEETIEETQQPDTRSLVDKVFGGTKKAILLLMTLTIVASIMMDKAVSAEFIDMVVYLYMIYFGAGGVKLGMDIQKKT